MISDRIGRDRDAGTDLPSGAGRPASASESVLAFLLYVLRVFTTRFWVFVTVALLVMALMAYSTLRSTPIYRATGVILIERQTSNLRQLDDPLQINTDDIDYYNTQVKVIQGPGLADRVANRWICPKCVQSISSARAPEGGPPSCAKCGTGPLKTIREHYGFGDDAAEAIAGSVDVVLARNNRILDIAFEHPDKKLAADVVNGVIEEYELDTAERRRKGIKNLEAEMRSELIGVEEKLNKSEQELVDFYRENNLHLGDELDSTKRRVMHEAGLQLLREELELSRLEAVAAQVKSAGDDVFKIRGVAVAHKLLDSHDSLGLELARATEEFKELGKKVGEKNQAYHAAAARVEELTRQVGQQAELFKQGILEQLAAQRGAVSRAMIALAKADRERLKEDQLLANAEIKRRNRDATRELFDALNLRVKESGISSGLELTNVQVLRRAPVPRHHVRPNMAFNMMVGFIVALITGAAAIVLLDRIDNTVRTTEDVEVAHDLPVLSVVPQARAENLGSPPAVACWKDEHSQLAEAFRRVRAAILLSVRGPQGGPIRQIMVVSPGPNEGKTITATNLAISLAQMGERTLLIDADFYRSDTHKLFGLDREKGLSTLLVTDIALSQTIQPTPVPFLDYLATGMIPPQPATLLGSARMTWVLQEAARTYSRIVIDTAPLVAVTDATLLAPHADATLLVVRDGKTSKTALHRSLQTLSRIGVRPLGFVFNGVRTGVGEFYFRYHHPSYELEPEARSERQPEIQLPTGPS